eukprot:scaffold2846_cov125-Isochrysis_galbana.AAC.5
MDSESATSGQPASAPKSLWLTLRIHRARAWRKATCRRSFASRDVSSKGPARRRLAVVPAPAARHLAPSTTLAAEECPSCGKVQPLGSEVPTLGATADNGGDRGSDASVAPLRCGSAGMISSLIGGSKYWSPSLEHE